MNNSSRPSRLPHTNQQATGLSPSSLVIVERLEALPTAPRTSAPHNWFNLRSNTDCRHNHRPRNRNRNRNKRSYSDVAFSGTSNAPPRPDAPTAHEKRWEKETAKWGHIKNPLPMLDVASGTHINILPTAVEHVLQVLATHRPNNTAVDDNANPIDLASHSISTVDILLCRKEDIPLIIAAPLNHDNKVFEWRLKDGTLTPIIISAPPLVLPLAIEGCLRTIGNVTDLAPIMLDGTYTADWSATITVPPGKPLSQYITMRSREKDELGIFIAKAHESQGHCPCCAAPCAHVCHCLPPLCHPAKLHIAAAEADTDVNTSLVTTMATLSVASNQILVDASGSQSAITARMPLYSTTDNMAPSGALHP